MGLTSPLLQLGDFEETSLRQLKEIVGQMLSFNIKYSLVWAEVFAAKGGAGDEARVEDWDLQAFAKKLDEDLDCRVYFLDCFVPPQAEEIADRLFLEENSLVFLKYFAKNPLSRSKLTRATQGRAGPHNAQPLQ